MSNKYLKPKFTQSEIKELSRLSYVNSSFRDYVMGKKREDWTDILMEELDSIVNSKFPKNFVLNIKGGIGRQMGIFKSALGLQIALKLKPDFNPLTHCAQTYVEINRLVKKHATRGDLFVLDEQVRDLKRSQMLHLMNIIESCRERQISFIIIGVPETLRTVSDYMLERFGESDDEHLPAKTVYYSVRKRGSDANFYYGFFRWNITPLSDPKWSSIWEQYMQSKSHHQERVIDGTVGQFDFVTYTKEIMSSEDFNFLEYLTDRGKANKPKIKNLVYKHYPNVTHEERRMVSTELAGELEKIFNESVDDVGDSNPPKKAKVYK